MSPSRTYSLAGKESIVLCWVWVQGWSKKADNLGIQKLRVIPKHVTCPSLGLYFNEVNHTNYTGKLPSSKGPSVKVGRCRGMHNEQMRCCRFDTGKVSAQVSTSP